MFPEWVLEEGLENEDIPEFMLEMEPLMEEEM